MNGWALDLFVAGRPAPQGSKRHVGGGTMVESSKAVGDWRTVMAWTAANAYAGAPLAGPVVLVVEFVMPRPKRLSARKPTPAHTSKPDVDKLLRAVGDAMTGVVWADDSHIVESVATKRYAEPDERPGAHLLVGAPANGAESRCDNPGDGAPPVDDPAPADGSAGRPEPAAADDTGATA